jgi:hypothetical protein
VENVARNAAKSAASDASIGIKQISVSARQLRRPAFAESEVLVRQACVVLLRGRACRRSAHLG